MDIGTYWFDDQKNHVNGEFDCVLKHPSSYSFYEVKYYHHKMTYPECKKEELEVRRLADDYTINNIGFISLSGFDFCSDEYDLIQADRLYSLNS